MEFARSPVARKAPVFSELMTPTEQCVSAGVFFMLDYILAAVGSTVGEIPRFRISGVLANRPGQSI